MRHSGTGPKGAQHVRGVELEIHKAKIEHVLEHHKHGLLVLQRNPGHHTQVDQEVCG